MPNQWRRLLNLAVQAFQLNPRSKPNSPRRDAEHKVMGRGSFGIRRKTTRTNPTGSFPEPLAFVHWRQSRAPLPPPHAGFLRGAAPRAPFFLSACATCCRSRRPPISWGSSPSPHQRASFPRRRCRTLPLRRLRISSETRLHHTGEKRGSICERALGSNSSRRSENAPTA